MTQQKLKTMLGELPKTNGNNGTIVPLRRGNAVKRFHTVERIREETVGHHSANVCAILLRLDPDCSRELLIAALMHDMDEAYTGDIPAPFKWQFPEAKEALAEGGAAYMEEYDVPNPFIGPMEYELLKLADMLDLVLSSYEEMLRGNGYAIQLIENGTNYIENLPCYERYKPEVRRMIMEVMHGR